jgi:hypothetical protein
VIASPTTEWTPVMYGNSYPDFSQDQQTGSTESDLVGNTNNPSFYTKFDDAGTPSLTDGTLGFRVRLGNDKNPAGFSGVLFVGLDANLDGVLDLFLGANNSGSNKNIEIYNPGTGANTSPSTTTITAPTLSLSQTASNYNWQVVSTAIDPTVNNLDINADGNNDYFLSFSIPFSNVVAALATHGITFNQNSAVRYVVATATQPNGLNQDLNGVQGGVNSSLTWADLGAITLPYTAGGVAIPEPSAFTLVLVGLGLAMMIRRK